MKFTTNLLSSNLLTQLEEASWTDFEGLRLNEFSEGVHLLDKNFPEFVELFRQIEKQMLSENMDSSEMLITECPIWGEYTVFSFEHLPSATYFDINITIDPVEKTCVAKAEAIDNESYPMKKEFESFKLLLNSSFSNNK
ncbi:hypothetical protein VNN28_10070 (plasmid) [Lactococcus formosensis]|uniref:hypothetical protein n=1 Tax=Lactococcus formosensis TaxID=1281486 RepID=UPI0030D175EF